jgi:hypothetical protein
MMDLADIIVIVIIDSSRLIYGRNVHAGDQGSLSDGKQMKRVSTGETGPKLRTASA